LKGTIKQEFNVSQSRLEESLDQSRDSDTDTYNSKTIQYTERSQFQEDIKNVPKSQATEYGKPFLQESKKDYL
jgi:methenyltetrahydromethanopterin cyclohydrolase